MPDPLEPGNFPLSAEEEKLKNEILLVLRKSLEKDYPEGNMLRRFHAKSLGLVSARFIVPDNLPQEHRVGLFSQAGEYNAYVRFSNASPKPGPDYERTVRGMAVKVFLEKTNDESKIHSVPVQDFVLTTNDILFPGTPREMLDALKLVFNKNVLGLRLFFQNPIKFIRFLRSSKQVGNVVELTYFSGTPYLFGKGKAVKWKFRPLQAAHSRVPNTKEKDYLTRRLATSVLTSDIGFDILVQFHRNPTHEPIEDSSVRWNTSFHKVATLILAQEDITISAREKLDEKITFNPWNCLPDHRPLGGNNRIRREIYRLLAELRE